MVDIRSKIKGIKPLFLDREFKKTQREIDESLRKDPDKRLSREEAEVMLGCYSATKKKYFKKILQRKQKEFPNLDLKKVFKTLNPLDLPEELLETWFSFDPDNWFMVQRYFPKKYWREYIQPTPDYERFPYLHPDFGKENEEFEIKRGERGGKYTEAKTKDGRPYRRYY